MQGFLGGFETARMVVWRSPRRDPNRPLPSWCRPLELGLRAHGSIASASCRRRDSTSFHDRSL